VAQSLNNLALLHQAQGRFDNVELLLKRALSIRENTLGPERSEVASTLDNLANLLNDQGRYVEAEALLKRSLAI
jgi:tetratricopeptide (TPR) repeat protein